ncbi:MAG: tetratricopeptide repeat protein [Anaerolineae bacterium]|nr:tetratricopeptide repeat protein [Anaerolineae bacterium]
MLVLSRRGMQHDVHKGQDLLRQAQQALDLGDLDKALSLAYAAEAAYEQAKCGDGEGYAHHLAGRVLTAMGEPDLAVNHFKAAVDKLADAHDQIEALLGLAEAQQAQHDAATLTTLAHARQHIKKLKGTPDRARLLHRVGYGFYEAEAWAEAEAAYREALDLTDEARDPDWRATLLLELGNTVAQLERMDEARLLFRQSAALARESGDLKALSVALHGQAVTYMAVGQAETALQLFDESLRLKRQMGDEVGAAYTLYEMGVMHVYLGQCDQAMPLLEDSVALYEAVAAPELEVARAGLHSYALAC